MLAINNNDKEFSGSELLANIPPISQAFDTQVDTSYIVNVNHDYAVRLVQQTEYGHHFSDAASAEIRDNCLT